MVMSCTKSSLFWFSAARDREKHLVPIIVLLPQYVHNIQQSHQKEWARERKRQRRRDRDRVRQRHIQRKTETEYLKKHLSSVKKQSEWDLLWQKLSQVTALGLYIPSSYSMSDSLAPLSNLFREDDVNWGNFKSQRRVLLLEVSEGLYTFWISGAISRRMTNPCVSPGNKI